MKIDFDSTTKKCTVTMNWFDRVINVLIVVAIACAVLYGIFKPDLKTIFPKREETKESETITFTSGTEIDWTEYKSIVGNKKLMKQYAKQKTTVTGYITQAPDKVQSSSSYYTAVIKENESADVSAVIYIEFNYKSDAQKIQPGYITIMDNFSADSNGAYLYCYDPKVIETGATK